MPRPRILVLAVALALTLSIVRCRGAAATEPLDGSPLVRHLVSPADADPQVAGWFSSHYVALDTARAHRGQLFVFLPGTGGVPEGAQRVSEVAARLGYHAIALMYADNLAILQACPGDPDPGCMANMRREIIEGVDVSPWVNVGYADGIDSRLAHLLAYLARQYPGEGWEAFLADGAVRWDHVAIAGLSQGGGHAAFIAKQRTVARVLMFGAPADGLDGQPGPWVAIGATPAERYYGFAHMRDPFTSIPPNWAALGLPAFGPRVRVESGAPPYGGSHMLTTDLPTANGSYVGAHPSVVADGATPLDGDGVPRFARVWRYMLGG